MPNTKLSSKLLVVSGFLMALTLSGCASLDRRLIEASVQTGVNEAKIDLPERPAECGDRKKEAHAALIEGSEIRVVLKKERKAHERQQLRQDRCEAFYDDVWRDFR